MFFFCVYFLFSLSSLSSSVSFHCLHPQVAKDVIKEFAADGVKYLELRSTPREEKNTRLTKRRYVETVLKAIQQCRNEDMDIDVR